MNQTFLEYCGLDVATTLECRNTFWPDLLNGYEHTYQITEALLEPLMFMQTRGIKVDMPAVEQTRVEILELASEKQKELDQLCGRSLNVNSSKDCQKYFYIELSIPPYYNDGAVTIDDTALQRLARGTARRPGLRQARLVQDIRGLNKLYGTYLNIEFDADGRLRCSYNPRGTKFGRLSSSKTVFGTGTNHQNLPQEFKKFLVADEGYLLWEVDKRQAEWVVVAYVSGDANMIRVVEEGKDTHVYTASLMFDVEEEVIAYENKIVGSNTDPERIAELRSSDEFLARYSEVLPRNMSGRQCGKKSNHGLNYDEGFAKFALINEIEQNEAKRIVELYHKIYPGIRVWYETVKRQLQRDRTLTNCFGRRMHFRDSWGPDLWKAAYSFIPQSSVVDSLNQGLVKIYHDAELCDTGGIDLLAQIHDSILMQVPISLVKNTEKFREFKERIFDYVSPTLQYNGRDFKIATDMKMGANWGGFHKETNKQGMREIKDLNEIPKLLEALGVTGSQ